MPNQDWWIVFKTKKEGDAPKQLNGELKDLKKGLTGAVEGMTGMSIGSLGMAGAITGVAMYAKQAVEETMKYGKQVNDLGRITGATAEDTSRLIQVGDDLQISYESLQKAAKSAAKNGISLTTDELIRQQGIYKTLKDPAEKAAYAQKIFGKDGLELQKILELENGELRTMVDNVESSLIMTEAQAAASKKLAKNMDNLGDKVKGASLVIGNVLVGALNDAFTAVEMLSEASGGYKTLMIDHEKTMRTVAKTYDEYVTELDRAAKVAGDVYDAEGNLYVVRIVQGRQVLELVEKNARLTKSQFETNSALEKGTAAVGTWGDEIDGSEHSTRLAALQNDNLTTSVERNKKMLDDVSASFDTLTTRQIYQRVASQLGSEEALALARRLGLVSETSYAAIKRTDELTQMFKDGKISAQEYRDRISEVDDKLRKLPDKKDISINVNFNGSWNNVNPSNVEGWSPIDPGDGDKFANGGSFVIPPGYEGDRYPLGPGKWANSGERVTVTPAGGSGGAGAQVVIENVYIRDAMDLEQFRQMLVKAVH